MPPRQRELPGGSAPRLYEFTLADGRKSYRADIEIDGRQSRFTLRDAQTRAEARKAHAALIAQHERGEVVGPSRRTVEQAALECLASMEQRVAAGDLAPRTLDAHRWRLNARVIPALGHRQLQKLTADDIARAVTEWRARGDAAWTIRGVLTSLGRVIRFSRRRGWISDDPMAKLEPEEKPRVEKELRRVLTLEEIRKLIESAPMALGRSSRRWR